MTAGSASIDVGTLDGDSAYKLLVGAVQPRPIAWVSTISREGIPNLAPFSFFTVASRNPATVLISVTQRVDGAPKHTLVNASEMGELTISIPGRGDLDAVQVSSEEVGPDVDEHQLAGLETLPSDEIAAPRLAAAAISLECVLDRIVEVGSDHLILARVLKLHAAPGVFDARHRVDNSVLQPLARLAGPWFSTVENAIPAPSAQRAGA
ncbi:flavin reductase family protein [Nesterenkonia populi]